jgi:ElaB/YqjD/DUF883 family membrane-anchored ribosome-binding protein
MEQNSAVTDKVDQAKDVVSAQATDAVERGRGMVQEQLDQRSTTLGEQLGSTSRALRQTAQQARQEGNEQQARLVESAAERADRASAFLIEADGERLLSEVEDFARRQPWVLAGVGFLAGAVLARAMKASSGRRYESRYDGRRVVAPQGRAGLGNGVGQRPGTALNPGVTAVGTQVTPSGLA